MKSTLVFFLILLSSTGYGQTLYVPSATGGIGASSIAGSIGIGTSSPRGQFDVAGSGDIYLSNNPNLGTSQSIYLPGHIYLAPYSGSDWTYLQARRLDNTGSTHLQFRTWNAGSLTDAMAITSIGRIGVGTNSPVGKLHIVSGGSSVSPGNASPISGDLVVQSNIGGRTPSVGAALEFVIPANSDGSNLWGQGRIITVAGNNTSGNATGMMILGTRRYFDKGTGIQWNYGDDIVISGNGNVGIGTSTPDAKLAVKGNIHTNEVKVDLLVPGPDYVFEPTYDLKPLSEIETYIKENKHLPEVPSAKEMEKNGVQLGEMNMLLLKKVEELTLYQIESNRKIEWLQKQIEDLKKLKN